MSHTQRGSPVPPPPPPILLLCPSSESILASGPRCPYHRLGFPFPPFPLALSLSLLPLPPSRNATPARQRRYPWADTGDARASLHLRSTLRALLSHRLERTMPLPSPPALTSPTTLRALALSPRAVARWKDHDCPRLSFARSRFLRSPHPFPHLGRVQHAVPSSEHPRCTSVTPVIVRLLTGMYANDMLGASRRDGPCARVYSGATRDPGSCRKPPPPDGHVEIGSFCGRHRGSHDATPRRAAPACARASVVYAAG